MRVPPPPNISFQYLLCLMADASKSMPVCAAFAQSPLCSHSVIMHKHSIQVRECFFLLFFLQLPIDLGIRESPIAAELVLGQNT